MIIESNKLPKNFVNEFVNINLSLKKVIKNPKRIVVNSFVLWAIFLIIACFWDVLLLLFAIRLTSLTYGICFEALLAVILYTTKNYLSWVKLGKNLNPDDRHVVYTFNPDSFEYNNSNKKVVTSYYKDYQCILVKKYGIYLIPKDTKALMFGLERKHLEVLREYLKSNSIELPEVEG